MNENEPTDIELEAPPSDRELQPGDVAIDTAQGSFVYVMRREARSVREYLAGESGRAMDKHLLAYPGNWTSGAGLEDAVYKVAYVPPNLKSFPDQPFDFPESRLGRVPFELASDDAMRVQDALAAQTLASILEAAAGVDVSDRAQDAAASAIVEDLAADAGIDQDTIQAARELAYNSGGNGGDE